MRRLWAIAFVALACGACVGDPVVGDGGVKQAGTRGGACLPMNQCAPNLTCLDSTCVELPDSGAPGDSSATDTGADGMMMMGDGGCSLAKPVLGSNCAQGEVVCVTSVITCLQTNAQCSGISGKVANCRASSTCQGMACCLDPSVQALAGTCPDKFNTGQGATVTGCGACPGREICASDSDCPSANAKHCHASIFDGTNLQFGVCGP